MIISSPASTNTAIQHERVAAQRIGLYGGAFDPPHLAHVALAAAAVQQLGLERLYIIPTGQPWMKQRQLTSGMHRLHMAQAAFASVPQAVVDDCELRRSGTTYTIDTLRELQNRHAEAVTERIDKKTNLQTGGISWFLIMGEDLLQTLPQWQRADDLRREVTIAMLDRPQTNNAQHGNIGDVVERASEKLTSKKNAGWQIVRLHLSPSAISSSAIRQGLQERIKQTTQDRLVWLQTLVPSAVARYIEHHQLYFSHDEL